jgi:NarL family two-component system response regulator LiaR
MAIDFPQRSDTVKVLIVDDNEQIREMTKIFLGGIAGEIRECEDGKDAFDAYADFLPDWVLMDWEMKQMDGLSATREIIEGFPTARILIFTQFDDSELKASALEAGAIGFVLKDDMQALGSIMQTSTAVGERYETKYI